MVRAMRLAALMAIVAASAVACAAAAPPPSPTATLGVPADRNVMGRPAAPVAVEEWADFF